MASAQVLELQAEMEKLKDAMSVKERQLQVWEVSHLFPEVSVMTE